MSDCNTVPRQIAVAQAVAASLSDYDAQLLYAPEYELPKLSARRVMVVPFSQTLTPVSRSTREATYQIQIGVLCRAKEENVPEFLALTESICLPFLLKRIDGAMCTNTEFKPIYVPEMLRKDGLFFSVTTLTFKEEVEG